MSLHDIELELRGVKLPPRETLFEDLTAHQIVEKINAFHERLKREANIQVAAFAESYFLNLIALYPVSMCSKAMTDNLKLVAALFYFVSQARENNLIKSTDQDLKEFFPVITPGSTRTGYTVEDLALIFDRPRSSIAEAVRQKQEEAQVMLEEAVLRCQLQEQLAKETANSLQKLTDDEKRELTQEVKKVEEKKRTSLRC